MENTYDYSLDQLSKEQLEVVQKLSKCENAEPCLKKLMSIIDGQASCEDIKAFEEHLNECNGCFQEYDINRAVRQLLATKLKNRCVPDQLKEQITNKLASI